MTPPTTAGSASGPTCYLHGIPMTPRGFPPLCVSWLCPKCATPAGAGFAIPEVHYLHVEGTPPNPPTTLTTYNLAETQLTALRAAVAEVSNDIAGYVAINDTDMALQSFLFRCMDKLGANRG